MVETIWNKRKIIRMDIKVSGDTPIYGLLNQHDSLDDSTFDMHYPVEMGIVLDNNGFTEDKFTIKRFGELKPLALKKGVKKQTCRTNRKLLLTGFKGCRGKFPSNISDPVTESTSSQTFQIKHPIFSFI